MYEASIRIPMILAGSGLPLSAGKNKKVDRPVENVDILPTLLELTGISPERDLPGHNLLASHSRTGSFAVMHEREGEAAFMWRTNTHKLILVLERKERATDYAASDIITGEFYDLQNDPGEWHDLYGEKEIETIQKEFTSSLLVHLHSLK